MPGSWAQPGRAGLATVLLLAALGFLRTLPLSVLPCGDSGAEAALLSTYRQQLEEMRKSVQLLRGRRAAEEVAPAGAKDSAMEIQMQLLTQQLIEAQAHLQQQSAQMDALQRTQHRIQEPSAPRMSPTLERMPLPSDRLVWADQPKRPPTYQELYEMLYAQPFDEKDNAVLSFPNFYKKTPHMEYPHSSLWLEGDKIMARIFQELGSHPMRFIVEAGSMHGGSAIRMAMELDKRGLREVPILCIDPWTGDLNMWLNRVVWDHLDVRHGRATTYDQFMINVRQAITDGRISPHHIAPFPVSSIIGARWLQATGFLPSLIYLDSAHEVDETYYELCLYWHLLEPGGILMGDDYGWLAVKNDVDRFVADKGLQLNMFGVYYNWFVNKPL